MNIYEKYVLPQIVHWVCGLSPNMRQRAKYIPAAEGEVLEIGIGSGHNLSLYDPQKVRHIIGVDPTPAKKTLHKAIEDIKIPVELQLRSAEILDMENQSVDTVVSTYTFCTIAALQQTLQEIRRVLRPDGQLIFVEHGKSPDLAIAKTQDRINPYWKKIGGGCHLNRDIAAIIEAEGFGLNHREDRYLPGWKPATYNICGIAHIR